MTDAILSLRGDNAGHWFLSIEIFGKETTTNIGCVSAKLLTDKGSMPYAEPYSKEKPVLKTINAKISIQHDKRYNIITNWLLYIKFSHDITIDISIDEKAVNKLLELGIHQIP